MCTAVLSALSKPQQATYEVEGFRCAACVPNLESGLKKVTGVAAVSTDLKQKRTVVQFAPEKTDVQFMSIAAGKARNAHGEPYVLSLVLKIKPNSSESSSESAVKALEATPGVKSARVQEKEGTVLVQFGPQGNATLTQLIAALESGGYQVVPETVGATSRQEGKAGTQGHDHSGGGSCCGSRGGGC